MWRNLFASRAATCHKATRLRHQAMSVLSVMVGHLVKAKHVCRMKKSCDLPVRIAISGLSAQTVAEANNRIGRDTGPC